MMRLLRRLRYWFRRGKAEAELAEEMEFHRAMLERAGSQAAMGNATLARETARGVWIWPWLESFWQDAVHGARTMLRERGFTITALLALGSAIGLNTSLFTIFNAVALRPWPVRDPAQMATIGRFFRDGAADFGIAEYRYLAGHSHSFTGLISFRNGERVKLDARTLQLTYVSGNYFRVLGVDLERGRGFLDQEDLAGAPQAVAVISHGLWEDQFGADPDIVGRQIRLDDIVFTVVGVTPPDFSGTNALRNDVWTTLSARRLLRPNDPLVLNWLTSPDYCCTPIAGRLAPVVSRTQAAAELAVLTSQFRSHTGSVAPSGQIIVTGTSWIESPRKKRQVVPVMVTLFLAVTLVLLLACANVGNLLLARASARRQEIAIRLSLGGSRLRLIRQLLIESILLASAAAALGWAMATVVPPVVLNRLAGDQIFHAAPDSTVLIYTIAVAALSCLAFGLAPALHATRGAIAEALKATRAAERSVLRRFSLRGTLLAVQVAISVILLINTGLLVRGMQRTRDLNPGFDVQNVSVASIDLPASQYGGERTAQLTRNLEAVLAGSPDLPSIGITLNPPLGNSTYSTSLQLAGEQRSPVMQISFNEISGGYADAMGMRLLAGRNFIPGDFARDVVITNESAARRWWPAESPLGKTALVNSQIRQIVGVISDAYSSDLTSVDPMFYFPLSGRGGAPFLLVRDRTPANLDRIAALVKQIEPRAQVRWEPLSASFERKLQPSIYGAEIAGMLGLLALAIASVGMSGVFAYVVSQRTREIGVRMALGARPTQIVRLVLASSAGALCGGLLFGIAGAAGISALLIHTIAGIDPADPRAYLGVVLLLSAAVAAASAIPARNATRVDPVPALRWD